jgi:hypothetical protein
MKKPRVVYNAESATPDSYRCCNLGFSIQNVRHLPLSHRTGSIESSIVQDTIILVLPLQVLALLLYNTIVARGLAMEVPICSKEHLSSMIVIALQLCWMHVPFSTYYCVLQYAGLYTALCSQDECLTFCL